VPKITTWILTTKAATNVRMNVTKTTIEATILFSAKIFFNCFIGPTKNIVLKQIKK